MSTDPCTGPFYNCGENVNYSYTVSTSASITQTRDNLSHFLLGDTDIIVNKVSRNFALSIGTTNTDTGSIAVGDGSGQSSPCVTETASQNGNVSEYYECTNTVLFFLDTARNNAIGKEIVESISFQADGGQLAEFRGMMFGNFYGHKFMITSAPVNRTTTYFVVLNGVKKILKAVTSSSSQYSSNGPLILVYPNPPSLGEPFDPDVIKYGFYDYHATGEGEGQSKILQDGGDDFYFTDWMRAIGDTTRNADQQKAADRYAQFYLNGGYSAESDYFNPGLNIDDTPLGSIVVDPAGDIFYSMFLAGEAFNFITGGDLSVILPGADKMYPIGLA